MRCPTCRRETTYEGNPFRPFCSERCQLIDLDNWLSERYRIPGRAEVTENSEAGSGATATKEEID
jgi:hypothetical protein